MHKEPTYGKCSDDTELRMQKKAFDLIEQRHGEPFKEEGFEVCTRSVVVKRGKASKPGGYFQRPAHSYFVSVNESHTAA